MGESRIESFTVTEPPTSEEVFASAISHVGREAMQLTIRSTREVPPPNEKSVLVSVRTLTIPNDGQFIVAGTTPCGEFVTVHSPEKPTDPSFGTIVTNQPL